MLIYIMQRICLENTYLNSIFSVVILMCYVFTKDERKLLSCKGGELNMMYKDVIIKANNLKIIGFFFCFLFNFF